MDSINKYPRTQHLEGSRLQSGDEDLSQVPFSALAGQYIVVEEKLDGANCGVRFDANANLLLQSRGHYLTGGARERHFNLLKSWASAHENALFDRLGGRYLMYGEWMYAKHTVFYDALPHYFLEFDLLDTEEGAFLSTEARRAILKGSPVVSVPVLYAGIAPRRLEELLEFIRPSLAKSPGWAEALKEAALHAGVKPERAAAETDPSSLSEGLYLKVEEDGLVVERLKWVRGDFLQCIAQNDTHWHSRPIIVNGLAPGVDLFAPKPTIQWDLLRASVKGWGLNVLLTREEFKRQVFARSRGLCVLCSAPAVDAHHIMDRKLFADGGYRLSNGAAVCSACHWRCETTEVPVEEVLRASGLDTPLLPPGFDASLSYDKWGNEIRPDGQRVPGPLFHDEGARRALEKGRVLWKFGAHLHE